MIVLFRALPDRVLALTPAQIEMLVRIDQSPPRSANWCGFLSRAGMWLFPTPRERARA